MAPIEHLSSLRLVPCSLPVHALPRARRTLSILSVAGPQEVDLTVVAKAPTRRSLPSSSTAAAAQGSHRNSGSSSSGAAVAHSSKERVEQRALAKGVHESASLRNASGGWVG